ncbi:MAG TPA: glycosyltransferase [Polyangiales bacterium]|nr:glycosyltransferase [Polyangiales bacterium]
MRIHHVVSSLLATYGGPSQSVPALCEGLAARGNDVVLHTYAPVPTSPVGRGFEVRAYSALPWRRRLGVSWQMAAELRSAAASGEILHVHGLWTLASLLPTAAVLGTHCKLVISPRGMLEPWALEQNAAQKRWVWRFLQGPAVRSAALLHATASTESRTLRELELRAPIAVVPNAVEVPEAGDVARFEGEVRTLLFLSRLHPKKGVDLLVRAWARVEPSVPEWRLRVVGPDEDQYLTYLQSLARELGVSRVDFGGPVDGRDKTSVYRAAQLYALPSHSENFGQGIAEALAHGLPVIAGLGTPWAALEQAHAGWHVSNDVNALSECLREALALSPEALREMGTRGRSLVAREFSLAGTARAMEDCYVWTHRGGTPPACIDLVP